MIPSVADCRTCRELETWSFHWSYAPPKFWSSSFVWGEPVELKNCSEEDFGSQRALGGLKVHRCKYLPTVCT